MQRTSKRACQRKKIVMKNFFLLATTVLILVACKKENDIGNLKTAIVGRWELKSRSCGECVVPFVRFPAGTGDIIVLSANGDFERRAKDTLLFKGNYDLQKSKLCNEKQGDIAFLTSEVAFQTPSFISVKNDTLTLSTPYCYLDGTVNKYRRVK